jgi:hypothetical protein
MKSCLKYFLSFSAKRGVKWLTLTAIFVVSVLPGVILRRATIIGSVKTVRLSMTNNLEENSMSTDAEELVFAFQKSPDDRYGWYYLHADPSTGKLIATSGSEFATKFAGVEECLAALQRAPKEDWAMPGLTILYANKGDSSDE